MLDRFLLSRPIANYVDNIFRRVPCWCSHGSRYAASRKKDEVDEEESTDEEDQTTTLENILG